MHGKLKPKEQWQVPLQVHITWARYLKAGATIRTPYIFTSSHTFLELSVFVAAHVQSLYKPKIIGRLTFNNYSKQGTVGLAVSTKHDIAENHDLKQLLMHIYQTQSMGGLLQTRCVAVYCVNNTGNDFISLQLTTFKVWNSVNHIIDGSTLHSSFQTSKQ